MKNKLWLSVLCVLLSMILGTAALAGTVDDPCPYCNDTATGYKYYSNGGTHDIFCVSCGTRMTGIHQCSGGTATCTKKAVCEFCGGEYGELAEHKWADATCTAPKTCTICGATEGDPLGHTPGAEATCTTAQTCTACGAELAPALGHTWADATCVAPKTCTVCGATEGEADPAAHKWADATCVAPKTCTLCGAKEGEADPKGHDWKKTSVVDPTCTEKGYTKYTCTLCDTTKKGNYTDPILHWYGAWTSNGDGTHTAACRREDCTHKGKTDCTVYTVAVDGDNLCVCPVCGMLGTDTQMTALTDAKVANVDKNAKPRGEAVLFGLEKPFDDVLYALTVAHEYAGKPEKYNGTVSVTVPLDVEDAFRLERVSDDGETREAVEYTYADGVLTFETDAAGLYLLVPEA